MGEFIEERLDACIRIGAESDNRYFVDATMSADGARYATLKNGKPFKTFDIGFIKSRSPLALEVASLFHRTYGGFAGFRIKAWDDFTTAEDGVSAPGWSDCTALVLTSTTFQMVKEYGKSMPALLSLGRPRRVIYKPVAGTVQVSVDNVPVVSGWSVDTTSGVITFSVAPVGTVRFGCEFDYPVAFDSSFSVSALTGDVMDASGLRLVELLNP